MKYWRIIPKITYINYRKCCPNMSKKCFAKWFEVNRFWYGRLIYVNIRHHAIELDFRTNWLDDMTGNV